MLDSEILEKLQGSSIEDRIRVIEAILNTLKHDVRVLPSQQNLSVSNPLKGKVIYYNNPYEPVAVEDWEALA
jgi:predicted RNA methylase